MKLHVKAKDQVIVIAGKDKGKKGSVVTAFPKTGKVIVEGVNIVTKHQKPRGQGMPGGIVHKEAAIEAIKYITSKELMADDYLMSNFSPVRASVLGSDKFLDQGEAPSEEALELSILEPMTGNTRIYPTCDNYDECDLKVKELLSAWYAGQYTTEDLVSEMETQCNAIIQQ